MRRAVTVLGALGFGCAGGGQTDVTESEWVEELVMPASNLFNVAGNAEVGVYAATQGIYKRDDGQWRLLEGTSDHVWRAISLVGARELWAAASDGTVLRIDGQTVTELHVPGVTGTLTDIVALEGQVWISSTDEQIWRWDGASWSSVRSEALAGRYMSGLYAPAPDQLFVHTPESSTNKPVGLSRYDGKTWVTDVVGKRWGYVASLDGSSSRDVWAVGMKHNGLFGKGGFAFHWDATQWKDTPIPVSVPLTAVSVRGDGDAWAVGWRGTLLHWDGQTWSTVATGGERPFTRVCATSDGAVYVIENDRRLLRWTGQLR